MMRTTVKRFVGPWAAPLINLGLRLAAMKAGVALVYHTIDTRQGDPSHELVPAIERSRFARQIRHLRDLYDVVAVEDFPAAVADRRRGQRFPVCLTFDDDCKQHVEHALPLLRAEKLPATFFLGGAGLVRPRSAWWERLQRAFDLGCSADEIKELLPAPATATRDFVPLDIHGIGEAIERLRPSDRDEVADRLLGLCGPDPHDAGLVAEAVATLVEAGYAIGFHTRRHDTLTQLNDVELDQALTEGRAELADIAGRSIDTLAYPHGYADLRVAEAAKRAGFRLGFTTTRCASTPNADPMLLGRVDPISDSLGAFALGIIRTLLTASDEVSPHGA
jgi:peptidoglycan/xylan/chitin deacetylase (PgdA/CDA1 family)